MFGNRKKLTEIVSWGGKYFIRIKDYIKFPNVIF